MQTCLQTHSYIYIYIYIYIFTFTNIYIHIHKDISEVPPLVTAASLQYPFSGTGTIKLILHVYICEYM